jgi:hypothetical protein
VDAGYIVYVGTAQDPSSDQARFKAEAQAIEDLANECSFPPKGARVEDRYEHVSGSTHEAYTKVGVDFQSCEQAKAATEPEAIRKLANVAMTEQVKRYQTLIDEPQPAELGEEPNETQESGETASSPAAGAPRTVVIARDEPTFFVVREQVAYYKQTIILPPPGAPAVLPAQSAIALAEPARQIRSYEAQHPEVKATPHSWSQVRPPEYRPQYRNTYSRPTHYQRGQAQPKRGKRRRRRRGDQQF